MKVHSFPLSHICASGAMLLTAMLINSVASAEVILFNDDFQADTVGAAPTFAACSAGTSLTATTGGGTSSKIVVQNYTVPGGTETGTNNYLNMYCDSSSDRPTYDGYFDSSNTTNGTVTTSWKMYLEGTGNSDPNEWCYMILYAGSNKTMSLQIGGQGRITLWDGTTKKVQRDSFFSLKAWNDVSLVADMAAGTYTLTSGTSNVSSTWTVTSGTNNYCTDLYVKPSCATGYGANWYFDDIKVTTSAVPEPSVAAMVVSALLGLSAYAWRKRR